MPWYHLSLVERRPPPRPLSKTKQKQQQQQQQQNKQQQQQQQKTKTKKKPIILVLLNFTCNLSLFAALYRAVIWFCRPENVADNKMILSANNMVKMSMLFGENWRPCFPWEMILCASSFMNRENSDGLAKHPCLRPCKLLKYYVFSLPHLTHACAVLYMLFKIRSILPWTPVLKSTDHNKECCTESNAFEESM